MFSVDDGCTGSECRSAKQNKATKHTVEYSELKDYGLHTGAFGVCATLLGRSGLVGVSVRRRGESRSRRLMNWIGCRGDPGDELFIDFGLAPLEEDSANEGVKEPLGSGVRGCDGGVRSISCMDCCCRVAELIHFSSAEGTGRRGESGTSRNASAKCSLINLESSDHPPPTRTMTVCERRILQKHNFGSSSPIQYLPL